VQRIALPQTAETSSGEGAFAPARLWVVGVAGCRQLVGQRPDERGRDAAGEGGEDLVGRRSLAPLVGRGWEPRRGGGRGLVLARDRAPDRIVVEMVADLIPWRAGTAAVSGGAVEFSGRLTGWTTAVRGLAGAGAAVLGAVVVAVIEAAAQRYAESFAAKMAHWSPAAAVGSWLRRVARGKARPAQRARPIKAVPRAGAAKTKVVQLTCAALVGAAGLEERPAAAAAIAAGASYAEVGAVVGMTRQGASARIRPYLAGCAQAGEGHR
jgi:hypothetical protein